MGVTILPTNPGFYHKPTEIHHLIDFVVARSLIISVLNRIFVRVGGKANKYWLRISNQFKNHMKISS